MFAFRLAGLRAKFSLPSYQQQHRSQRLLISSESYQDFSDEAEPQVGGENGKRTTKMLVGWRPSLLQLNSTWPGSQFEMARWLMVLMFFVFR